MCANRTPFPFATRRVVCRKKYYDERELTYETLEASRRRSAAAAALRARQLRERARGQGEHTGGE